MSNITLSILIPTIKSRQEKLKRLLSGLTPQLTPEVQVVIDADDGEVTIGAKRNRMLRKAKGDYVCFVDDDDVVSPQYVQTILEALQGQPDAVGFKMRRFVNDVYEGYTVLSSTAANRDPNQHPTSFNISTGDWFTNNNIMHLNPVRRAIALKHEFPDTNTAEDVDWAKRVRKDIKREVYVDEFLYDYLFLRRDRRDDYTNAIRQLELLKQLGVLSETGEIRV